MADIGTPKYSKTKKNQDFPEALAYVFILTELPLALNLIGEDKIIRVDLNVFKCIHCLQDILDALLRLHHLKIVPPRS